MPILLFVSIVGLRLNYICLAEEQGFFCSASDDHFLGLVGSFTGADQLWFWLWVLKRSAKDCLGYTLFYFLRYSLSIKDNRCKNKSFQSYPYVILHWFLYNHSTMQVAS